MTNEFLEIVLTAGAVAIVIIIFWRVYPTREPPIPYIPSQYEVDGHIGNYYIMQEGVGGDGNHWAQVCPVDGGEVLAVPYSKLNLISDPVQP